MQLSNQKIAGIILFVGTFLFILALQVAEFIDGASYNVANNHISDLGTYCTTTCVELPSHNLFDVSVFLLGLAIIFGSYFLYRTFKTRVFSGLLILSGIGAMGVGLFPENFATEHRIFSDVVFFFGALAAIASYKIERKPLNYFSPIIGAFSVIMQILYVSGYDLGLGVGGLERMVAYPILLWGVALGAHMIAWDAETTSSLPSARP
jgi:hypothetical membrane protein